MRFNLFLYNQSLVNTTLLALWKTSKGTLKLTMVKSGITDQATRVDLEMNKVNETPAELLINSKSEKNSFTLHVTYNGVRYSDLNTARQKLNEDRSAKGKDTIPPTTFYRMVSNNQLPEITEIEKVLRINQVDKKARTAQGHWSPRAVWHKGIVYESRSRVVEVKLVGSTKTLRRYLQDRPDLLF